MDTNIQRYLNIIFIDFFFNCKDKYDHGVHFDFRFLTMQYTYTND